MKIVEPLVVFVVGVFIDDGINIYASQCADGDDGSCSLYKAPSTRIQIFLNHVFRPHVSGEFADEFGTF